MLNCLKYCLSCSLLLCFGVVIGQQKSIQNQTPSFKQVDITKPIKIFEKPVPINYYTKDFGFFCKQEARLEKQIKLPVKFRLGSLEYCNYLEQKNGPQIAGKR